MHPTRYLFGEIGAAHLQNAAWRSQKSGLSQTSMPERGWVGCRFPRPRRPAGGDKLRAMEHEIPFPNPVTRHDLVVPRRRWPYLVGGVFVAIVVGVLLLPQVVSSRIGRNLIKTYMESRFRGQVWITDLKTSITDSRVIGTIAGEPAVDLISRLRLLEIDAPMASSLQLTRAAARQLSLVNPYLANTVDGTGRLELTIDFLSTPLLGNRGKMTGGGQICIRDAVLASGKIADGMPRELISQWQAVVGNISPTVRLEMEGARFTIGG